MQSAAAALVMIYVLAPASAAGTEHQGRVVGVADGDTVTVLTPDNKQLKVRLACIDAPEKAQAFGKKSKQSLSELVFGKDVRVVERDIDRYGRVVGTIWIGELDANLTQVQRGVAWVYRQYCSDRTYIGAEGAAQKRRVGLWADTRPTPPWEYRRSKKSAASARAAPNDAAPPGSRMKCGTKRRCSEMTSCEEARFHLACGVGSLDGDKDGVPCEALCRWQ